MSYHAGYKIPNAILSKWVVTNKDNTKELFNHDEIIIHDYYNQYEDNQFGSNVRIRHY